MFCWKWLLRLGKQNKQGDTKLTVCVPVNRSLSGVIVHQTWLVTRIHVKKWSKVLTEPPKLAKQQNRFADPQRKETNKNNKLLM